jgi:hypothetical protein
MAPGPRVHIADSIELLEEKTDVTIDEDDDDEQPEMRYYKSKKILGELYRSIDEQEFLKTLHQSAGETTDVLEGVWRYVQKETMGFQWDHLFSAVQDVKEMYVSSIPSYPPDGFSVPMAVSAR